MPELPEVETVVRSLAPHLPGRRIVDAEFRSRFVTPGGFAKLRRQVVGRTIVGVERRGKFILVTLDHGLLAIHLGMTGKLLLDAPRTPHTRAIFTFEDGILLYDDSRQFGRIEWSLHLPPRIAKLGPEPLEISFDDFYHALHRRKTRIKPLLLNQTFLRGLGNIYVDEVLFRSGIHPNAIAARLSKPRARHLHQSIGELLRLAIEYRGSSISDYVDAGGNQGSFQLLHRVYGKQGEPCSNCGAPIRRIVVAQRGTHLCPNCQRR
ncbi:MAG: bifunctional DNA-formamidopyrimidine glycosylase/DNA-(apurinic or apyrimidinic site) lyase [Bryobacteraceae bacterium]